MVGGGRWRLELVVPHAAVEELLPAGQLLRRASTAGSRPYGAAKGAFLAGLARAGIAAGAELGAQVAALVDVAAAAATAAAAAVAADGGAAAVAAAAAPGAAAPSLPSLRELRGQWSGRVTLAGGGPGQPAPLLEFDLSGSGWRAGPYLLDRLALRGAASPGDGVSLEELRLGLGRASLTARGTLLGPAQDASFALEDFPVVLLQPLFAALPALQVRAGL